MIAIQAIVCCGNICRMADHLVCVNRTTLKQLNNRNILIPFDFTLNFIFAEEKYVPIFLKKDTNSISMTLKI